MVETANDDMRGDTYSQVPGSKSTMYGTKGEAKLTMQTLK